MLIFRPLASAPAPAHLKLLPAAADSNWLLQVAAGCCKLLLAAALSPGRSAANVEKRIREPWSTTKAPSKRHGCGVPAMLVKTPNEKETRLLDRRKASTRSPHRWSDFSVWPRPSDPLCATRKNHVISAPGRCKGHLLAAAHAARPIIALRLQVPLQILHVRNLRRPDVVPVLDGLPDRRDGPDEAGNNADEEQDVQAPRQQRVLVVLEVALEVLRLPIESPAAALPAGCVVVRPPGASALGAAGRPAAIAHLPRATHLWHQPIKLRRCCHRRLFRLRHRHGVRGRLPPASAAWAGTRSRTCERH